MKARFARWHASLSVGLFGRRQGATRDTTPDAEPPGAVPFLSDLTPPASPPTADALLLLARLIHERTTLSPWRDADFWERERSFLAARAVLEEMGAHHWLGPSLRHLSFRSDAAALENCVLLSERRPGRRK